MILPNIWIHSLRLLYMNVYTLLYMNVFVVGRDTCAFCFSKFCGTMCRGCKLIFETNGLKGIQFQVVETQALSTRGQPDAHLQCPHKCVWLTETRFRFFLFFWGGGAVGASRVRLLTGSALFRRWNMVSPGHESWSSALLPPNTQPKLHPALQPWAFY